ncbi:MAG: hypothetical protein RIQ81_1301 [Pseudomonadota bacterium]|jgi:tetratricopeptide (TPR) repeat protein
MKSAATPIQRLKAGASAEISPALAGFVVAGVMTAWGYGDTCHFPFLFDDLNGIVNNPVINNFSAEGLRGIFRFGGERVLGLLSFVVSWGLSGPDPCGFRKFNFFLHVIAAGFCGLSAVNLARLAGSALARRNEYLLAIMASGLFAAHPVQTQAVTYIYQRLASLAGCFGLASFAFFTVWLLRREAWAWWLSFLLAALAMMSKPNVATLPVLFVFAAWAFTTQEARGSQTRKFIRADFLFLCLPLIIPALMAAGSGIASRVASHGLQGLGAQEYFLVQGRVIWKYLQVIFWPPLQSVDHVVQMPAGGNDPLTWAGIAGWIFVALAVIASVIAVLDRRSSPWFRMACFGVCWFFGNLLVESSIFPIRDFMMEQRAYLPFAGICWGLAAILVAFAERIDLAPRRQFLALMVVILVLTGLASLTEKRNRVWESAESLWSSVLKTDPGSLRARLNLGNALLRDGRYEDALARYRELSSLMASSPPVLQTAVARELPYQETMALILLRRFDEASGSADSLAANMTDDPLRVSYVRGFLAYARGNYRDALSILQFDGIVGALARDIAMTRARVAERLAADMSLSLQEREAFRGIAQRNLEEILMTSPHDPEATLRMARVLAASGSPGRAQDLLRDGLLNASAGVAPWLLAVSGELLEDPLRPELALKHYREAIKRFPRHPGLRIWFGSFLAMLGDHDAIHQLIGGASDVDVLADNALQQAARLSGSLQFDESVNLLKRALRLCESGPRKCTRVPALADAAARNLLLANPAAQDEAENLMARGRSLTERPEADGNKP